MCCVLLCACMGLAGLLYDDAVWCSSYRACSPLWVRQCDWVVVVRRRVSVALVVCCVHDDRRDMRSVGPVRSSILEEWAQSRLLSGRQNERVRHVARAGASRLVMLRVQ